MRTSRRNVKQNLPPKFNLSAILDRLGYVPCVSTLALEKRSEIATIM